MRFYGRDICITNLQEFCEKHFASIFFSSFRSESLFSDYIHCLKVVKKSKHSFQLDIEGFEKEIKNIVTTSNQPIRTIYFEELKEYVNSGLIDWNKLTQELKCWHVEDPELFDVTKFDEYIKILNEIRDCFLAIACKHLSLYDAGKYDEVSPKKSHPSETTKTISTIIDSIPKLISEAIPEVLKIFKVFFNPNQYPDLETLLRTGKSNSSPLLFNDNGNRLTDAFKKLKENDFITGCDKKDLENWIGLNFNYVSRKKIKTFTPDYLEKCISRKDTICKNPLFNIKNGKIVRE